MAVAQAQATDRRAEARNPALLTGKIVYGTRDEFSVDCVIRNTSARGSRVRSSLPSLPDQFKLLVYKSGQVHDAEIVWRGQGEFGVRLGEAEQLSSEPPPREDPVRRLWVGAVLQGI